MIAIINQPTRRTPIKTYDASSRMHHKNTIIDADAVQRQQTTQKSLTPTNRRVIISVPHRYSIIDADGLQTARYERQTKQHPCEEVIFA